MRKQICEEVQPHGLHIVKKEYYLLSYKSLYNNRDIF